MTLGHCRPLDYDALRLFLHLSRDPAFLAGPAGSATSARRRCRGCVQRLEREPGWPLLERDQRTVRADRRGRSASPPRPRHAGALATSCSRTCAATAPRRCPARSRCSPRSPPARASCRAAERLSPGLPRHPHPARDRLRGRRAGDAAARDAVDVAVAALPDRVPGLAGHARPPAHAAGVRGAALAVRGQPARSSAPRSPGRELPIVLPASGQARGPSTAGSAAGGSTPRIYGEVPGSEAMLSLVSLGCGVGIVPAPGRGQEPAARRGPRPRCERRRHGVAGRVPRRRLHPTPQADLTARPRLLGLARRPRTRALVWRATGPSSGHPRRRRGQMSVARRRRYPGPGS